MNAIDLLKRQHEEVRQLFEELEQTTDEDEKQALFQELADNLAAHATIEERIFYPAAYAKKTRELLTEAVEEHLAMKRLIADLLGMLPEHENFEAKIKVLKEQVEHHVEEEEGKLFKAARQELGTEELKKLGAEMNELFDEEMEGEPSEAVPDQTDEAAPLR
ncbi:MAG TPA: hemerythrin domain-containing protein [Polyangia bacterium]|jgi:hemerythrin-like domain-containing protein|nr:hemerythrin domain-containing protein [Polyangia bacterium]